MKKYYLGEFEEIVLLTIGIIKRLMGCPSRMKLKLV